MTECVPMPKRRPALNLPVLLVTALVVAAPAAAQTLPPPPIGLTAIVSVDTVTLTWTQPGGSPTTYVVEAGSAPGLANLASVSTGSATAVYMATAVPAGNYFVRVRARNAWGTSDPSNEVIVSVGASCQLPPAPPGLTSVVGGLVGKPAMDPLGLLSSGGGLRTRTHGPLQRLRGSSPGVPGRGAARPVLRARQGAERVWLRAAVERDRRQGAVPSPPGNFAASVIGKRLRFDGTRTHRTLSALYQLEAGSAPGLSDIAVIRIRTWTLGAKGYTATDVPPGTYYARVRAVSARVGPPSNELAVTVGAPQAGTSTVTFTGLSPLGDPFVSHLEAGFLAEPVSGPWTISGNGRPGPFIQFVRLASDPLTTERSA